MFKSGMKSQGKFLVKMISMAVSMIDDPDKFSLTMVKLTETHNERGIKSIECKHMRARSFLFSSSEFFCYSFILPFDCFLICSPVDGIVGEVLFWTVRRCLGEAYTPDVQLIWTKVVSRMLKIMIPCAVAFELQSHGVHQRNRFSEASSRGSMSGGQSTASGGQGSRTVSVVEDGDKAMEKKYAT
jgi:hemoglobin-like flavoprotein